MQSSKCLKRLLQTCCMMIVLFMAKSLVFANGSFDWFWFIYEQGTYYDSTYTVYRPLYVKNVYLDSSFSASLMPLIYWNYTTPNQDATRALLGFYVSIDYRSANHYENDTGVFPFVMYGTSNDKEDQYFHLWPFGGTVKSKLGADSITTCAFPGFALFILYPTTSYYVFAVYLVASMIPIYAHYTIRDYDGHAIIWPLIRWGKSPNRDDVRIMPFYAHSKKKGYYSTASYGMLYNVREEYIGNDTMHTVFLVPFYARRWLDSGKADSSTLLWPFFSWGYNDKHGNVEINFPWPLVQIRDCDDPYIYKRIFFPFYGKYIEKRKTTFFISPFYFVLEKQKDSFHSQYSFYGILFWHFKRDYKYGHKRYGNHWRFYKLWPLFHYEYNDKGNSSFAILSIFPFRDEEGYERLYQPFFSLVEYATRDDGSKRFGLLLRTYFQSWGDSYFKMKIPFIISYHRRDDTVQHISLLLSFFEYTNDETINELCIGWIPVYRNVKDQKQYDAKKKLSLQLKRLEGGYDSKIAYGSTMSYYNDATGYMVRF